MLPFRLFPNLAFGLVAFVGAVFLLGGILLALFLIGLTAVVILSCSGTGPSRYRLP